MRRSVNILHQAPLQQMTMRAKELLGGSVQPLTKVLSPFLTPQTPISPPLLPITLSSSQEKKKKYWWLYKSSNIGTDQWE